MLQIYASDDDDYSYKFRKGSDTMDGVHKVFAWLY